MERPQHQPRMSKKNRQRTCRRLRITAVISGAFAAVALAAASPALADSPIQNPFFKDQGASGSNSGTDLSGWSTSPLGQVISTNCWTNVANSAGFDCKPETGTTIPVVGSAGTPAPSQALISGGMGTTGVFKSIRS